MTVRVLLLGGTGEARSLAALLADRPGVEVVSSLAGRVRTPLLPVGDVRIGGFGGLAGLTKWLRTERIDAVVDATHPFAATITANAVQATRTLGIPLVVLRRPGWQAVPGDDWHRVDTLPEAGTLLPELGDRVFLATGRGGVSTFAARDDLWFLLRFVDPPAGPLPKHRTVVRARGPFVVPGEGALLREHRIKAIITRDSGGDQTAAKLTAARELHIPVILVRRPPLPEDVQSVTTEDASVRWLERVLLGNPASP